MKDLKHLAFFEDLLQDSGNGLVEQSRAAGNHIERRPMKAPHS